MTLCFNLLPTPKVKFPLHPKYKNSKRSIGTSTWSRNTPYGGSCATGNTCDPTSDFDCCIETSCKDYQIPVVITLLQDANGGNHSMTMAEIDAFFINMNNQFDCLGIPFEIFKATHWDNSRVNYQGNTNGLFMGDPGILRGKIILGKEE